MTEREQKSVLRPTDDEARRLARQLARGARFGALAVLEPATGHPFSSRVLLGTDSDGVPVMLSSMLSTHTKALLADPRCSLLVGEPGKGDPLAWPRLTLVTEAQPIESDSESRSRIQARFLRRHPKASVYVNFTDFRFFKLAPKWASLNGGFGKAYNISGEDMIVSAAAAYAISNHELYILDEVNALGKGRVDLFVNSLFRGESRGWKVIGVDAAGMDLARKEQLFRHEFGAEVQDAIGLIELYSRMLKELQ